jgi:amidase
MACRIGAEGATMTMNRRFLLGAAASTVATMTVTPLTPTFGQKAARSSASEQRLDYGSVSELRALLDARMISATELFEHAVGRIEALDSRINAVVVRDFERARAAAREADAALARGERRPLLGIPMTVKESFNIGGLPTTWGLPMGRDWRAA